MNLSHLNEIGLVPSFGARHGTCSVYFSRVSELLSNWYLEAKGFLSIETSVIANPPT